MTRTPLFLLPSACTLLSLGCGSPSHAAPAPAAASAAATAPASAQPATPAASALAEAAAALQGTWQCHGSVVGPEGPSQSKVEVRAALALGEAWLRTELQVVSGKYPYAFTSYRTYQPAAQAWLSVIVDNLGGHTVSRSADGVTWTGTASSPMGELHIKDTETLHAPGKLTLLGQYSQDGGASYGTGYELSCER